MGFDIEGNDTFCDVLGNLLSRHLQRKVEMINAGILGFSTFQGLHELQTRILKLHPDLVVLNYAWNDHTPAWTINHENLPDKAYLGRRFVYMRTYQLLKLGTRELQTRLTGPPATVRVSVEDYKSNLIQMITILRSNAIVPVLLTQPSTSDVRMALKPEIAENAKRQPMYNQAALEVNRSTGVLCVDMVPIFEKHHQDPLFFDTVHPRPKGHLLIGRELAKAILSRYWNNGVNFPDPPVDK